MLPQWQTGRVTRIEQAAPATRRFWIELPETEAFPYKPGQFVTLDLPIHEQRNRRWRSYSIASAPDGSNLIELVVVQLPGGAGSGYLFDAVKEGTELTLRGPHGIFTMPADMEQQRLLLVCTGTGVAPFRSMVQYLRSNPEAPRPAEVHLIFGCRTQEDLLYREELEAAAQSLPGFHYHPTLSRESWDGYKGYVHAIYEILCCDRPAAQFMLCGWRGMIDEAKQRILAMGYEKKAIHLELYG